MERRLIDADSGAVAVSLPRPGRRDPGTAAAGSPARRHLHQRSTSASPAARRDPSSTSPGATGSPCSPSIVRDTARAPCSRRRRTPSPVRPRSWTASSPRRSSVWPAPGVVLVGHSIGGMISLEIAARHPRWPLVAVATSGNGARIPAGGAAEALGSLPLSGVVDLPVAERDGVMFGPAGSFTDAAGTRRTTPTHPRRSSSWCSLRSGHGSGSAPSRRRWRCRCRRCSRPMMRCGIPRRRR